MTVKITNIMAGDIKVDIDHGKDGPRIGVADWSFSLGSQAEVTDLLEQAQTLGFDLG